MNLKVAEEATQWARAIKVKHGNEIPDWSTYRRYVNAKTGASNGTSGPVPREYHYAYLRLKGHSHMQALERLDLSEPGSTVDAPPARRRWWQFW